MICPCDKKVVIAAAVAAALVGSASLLQQKGIRAHVALFTNMTVSKARSLLGKKGATSTSGIRPVAPVTRRGYTKEELAEYDGVKNERILLSVKRKVYEVSPHFYGPGAHYHVFAGKEVSRPFAKTQLSDEEANKYWVPGCTEEELETLEEYVTKFDPKYPCVGWFIPDESFYDV